MNDFFLNALEQTLSFESVPASQVVEGEPSTGVWEAQPSGESNWGVWEMTPGAMSDVEEDELCVVIKGIGTLERHHNGKVTHHDLVPGVVLRLTEGEHTIWRVSESLRKVYWMP